MRLVEGSSEISRITLVRAARSTWRPAGKSPGEIDSAGHVATGIGSLDILELQPEGKRPMPLDAYRNGHRWEGGMRLESIT